MKALAFDIYKMSDNVLDWTMPPPNSDGSVQHESHGDESPSQSEGKKRKTRSPMWNHFTVVPEITCSESTNVDAEDLAS
ncbi:hypothetical protein P8452_51998 [Trifolium repens]|nr:hypothetical protein P8452_51998 [Trifolium repens]